MRGADGPVVQDVVLVGAGHANVQVLAAFAMRPLPGVRLTLVTREVDTPYSGMLPGLIAGLYTFDEAHIDTGPLARRAGARLYRDEAIGLDVAGKRIICRGRPPVPYDLLSLDIGARPNVGDVTGAAEFAITVKPIDGFLARFEPLLARVRARRGRSRVAVVGGGAGGVELMLSVERRLRAVIAGSASSPERLSFTLIASADGLLPTFPKPFRARFRAILRARGIGVANARVTAVEPGLLLLEGRKPISADEILWTTEAAPAAWLKDTGLKLDGRGFLRVDETLRAIGCADIFAAGDAIAFAPRDLPKSGVYAVRAGPILAENIRATLMRQPLKRFRPQRQTLYILSTGERSGVATRNGITVAGDWVWHVKDWIDRRFMARFNDLAPMPPAATSVSPLAGPEALAQLSADPMRCGGCGAKVGASVLSRVLVGLEPARRQEVVVGLDATDDAAVVDLGGEALAVHTVDYFRAMIDDPYLFGKIAANHALGDIFAMGATPLTALAVATVPYGPEAKIEADLGAMMIGANETLRQADCALVGGHTSEGADLSLGFALNGLVARNALLRKSGMRPGDALVLTKPLGTGTLLAADMRGRAKARWVMAALEHMLVSSRAAATILAAHGAGALTDVTGFGLLGHLVEMAKASGVAVMLDLNALPVLAGARETIAMGIMSSLGPQNMRLRRALRNPGQAARLPLYPLLFDPQTAGGLLASLPAERAPACLRALRAAGYRQAAICGHALEPHEGPEWVSLVG